MPTVVVSTLPPGYYSGRGGLRQRRVFWDPSLVSCTVGALYTFTIRNWQSLCGSSGPGYACHFWKTFH